MLQRYQYHILLHFIIFLWGFTGILGKLIHLPAMQLVWWRVVIASISLMIALPFLKIPLIPKDKKHLWKLVLVGMVVSMHWITFYVSIQLSTASLGILCLSTTTLHVTWLEPIIMKRKFSLTEFILGLIVIYGIYFVSDDFNAQDYKALMIGLSSAFLAALFSVSNARLAQEIHSAQITLWELVVGIGFISVLLMVQGQFNASLFHMGLSDILWLLFLAILCTSFAFLVCIEVVKRLGAFTVSLSINLEPVYTIVLAIFILHENEILGKDFYIGSGLIILVVIGNALIKYQKKRVAMKEGSLDLDVYKSTEEELIDQ